MLNIIKNTLGEFDGRLLDVGCASGLFLSHLRQSFPNACLEGLERNENLVTLACNRLRGQDIEVTVDDAAEFTPTNPYDAIVASAILSVFEDPLPVLDTWMSWLKAGGHLFVFGRFNSKAVDTRTYFRSHYRPHGWETGLTSYAIQTVENHLRDKGYGITFRPFVMDTDIPESADPIRHYTLSLADGRRIMLNGANVIAEQYFLTVKRGETGSAE